MVRSQIAGLQLVVLANFVFDLLDHSLIAQIEGFRQALAKVDQEMTGKRAAAVRGS